MAFLYETHLHTGEGSACGVSSGRDYVKRYIDLGYTGIIITDHFFRGNTRADRALPWKKWVSDFCRGYEVAREEGERRGLDVFFGWEETIEKEDFLVYGLDKKWLLEHPESVDWNRKEQFEEVRRHGGCVVHAHPFRYAGSTKAISVFGKYVDAVEAANSGNNESSDALAWALAKEAGIPFTAGSDIHHARDVWAGVVFGVFLEQRMESVADYVSAILNNSLAGLAVPPERFNQYY